MDNLSLRIKESRKALQNPYAHLSGDGRYEIVNEDEDYKAVSPPPPKEIKAVQSAVNVKPSHKNKWLSDTDIEQVAIDLQRALWRKFSKSTENPIDVLNPLLVFKEMGYTVDRHGSLGQFESGGQITEVAGTIDNQSKSVQISEHFDRRVQNFTLAHELGHALLHTNETRGLHRDRNSSDSVHSRRGSIEYQADKFAVFFLMPEKLLRKKFKELFLTECFVLNDDTIFALGTSQSDIVGGIKYKRDLSRLLASIESYNGKIFYSLARQFKVSIKAMAIRLEELELLAF